MSISNDLLELLDDIGSSRLVCLQRLREGRATVSTMLSDAFEHAGLQKNRRQVHELLTGLAEKNLARRLKKDKRRFEYEITELGQEVLRKASDFLRSI